MEVKILTRATTNWDEFQSLDQYLEQFKEWYGPNGKRCALREDKYNLFVRNMHSWDKTFEIPYTKFRTKIKEISRDNWSRVGCEIARTFRNEDENTIVIPSDDDDWFNPSVVDVVKNIFEMHKNIDIVRWDCWRYQTQRSDIITFLKKYPSITGSNGYALRLNLSPERLYGNHMLVKEYDQNRVFYLQEPLSIWLGHPGSFSYLSDHLRFGNSDLDDRRLFSGNDIEKVPIPEPLLWAEEEIIKTRNLIQESSISE